MKTLERPPRYTRSFFELVRVLIVFDSWEKKVWFVEEVVVLHDLELVMRHFKRG